MVTTLSAPARRRSGTGVVSQWQLSAQHSSGGGIEIIRPRSFPFRIGRRAELQMTIKSPIVSSCHAELIRTQQNDLSIRDLGSTNGTFVNGERISGERQLRDGDLVEIGDCLIRLHEFRTPLRGCHLATIPGESTLQKTQSIECPEELIAKRSFLELMKHQALLPCFQSIHNPE
ncbi:MAG: FHA domain-containing protein, partial [Planctomycetaceae bacterium]|nr:FHA domain-containing protein [Planctomycetaceae bacterium]